MCKSVKGIGAQNYGGFEPEQLIWLGGGAVVSKALTIPLVKAINPSSESFKNILYVGLPFALGYYALTKSHDEKVQAAGIGAIATSFLTAVELYMPSVFQASLKGVGSDYSVGEVIDLNESEWSYVPETQSVSGPENSNGVH